jgi:hypothetical protein
MSSLRRQRSVMPAAMRVHLWQRSVLPAALENIPLASRESTSTSGSINCHAVEIQSSGYVIVALWMTCPAVDQVASGSPILGRNRCPSWAWFRRKCFDCPSSPRDIYKTIAVGDRKSDRSQIAKRISLLGSVCEEISAATSCEF